jgi:hypothetical protein
MVYPVLGRLLAAGLAQAAEIRDAVRDETGATLPGVSMELRPISRRSWRACRSTCHRFNVGAGGRLDGATRTAGIVSLKGGIIFGPFSGTEWCEGRARISRQRPARRDHQPKRRRQHAD